MEGDHGKALRSLWSLMWRTGPDNVDTQPQEGSSWEPQILSQSSSKTSVIWPHPLLSNIPWGTQVVCVPIPHTMPILPLVFLLTRLLPPSMISSCLPIPTMPSLQGLFWSHFLQAVLLTFPPLKMALWNLQTTTYICVRVT